MTKAKPPGAIGALVVTMLFGVSPAGASARVSHDIVYLRAPFNLAFEGSSSSFTVERCCHGTSRATADFAVTAETAAAGQDFGEKSGTVEFSQGIGEEDVDIEIVDDAEQEPLETADIALTGSTGGPLLSSPKSATLTIIDNDGPSRIGWSAVSYSTFESRKQVTVTITRAGDAAGAASVAYATAPDSAGQDDFTAASGNVNFSLGQRFKTFDIELTDEREIEDEESFNLQLSDPTGAELAENAASTVEILDDDNGQFDTAEPITQFHRPLDDHSYTQNKLRDIHVFADDEASGIKHIEMAIRQTRDNGRCRWFTGKDFVRHSCNKKLWVRLKGLDFVIYELPIRLPPSEGKGASVRYYTGYSRGIDAAGNFEDGFDKGRNVSHFEIKS